MYNADTSYLGTLFEIPLLTGSDLYCKPDQACQMKSLAEQDGPSQTTLNPTPEERMHAPNAHQTCNLRVIFGPTHATTSHQVQSQLLARLVLNMVCVYKSHS